MAENDLGGVVPPWMTDLWAQQHPPWLAEIWLHRADGGPVIACADGQLCTHCHAGALPLSACIQPFAAVTHGTHTAAPVR